MGNLNKGSLLKAALWGGVALCTPMASTAAWATDVDAGDYVALPPGSNLAIVYAICRARRHLCQGRQAAG